jgi:PilZ domain
LDNPGGLETLLGQTALVEGGTVEATGTVAAVEGGVVVVSCDQECWPTGESRQVVISIFAPDALYRLSGKASSDGRDVVGEQNMAFERIQRRRWPRRRMDLPVTLCPVSDGARVGGIPGRTVDVSVGGVCVETLRPVEGGGDPMVILSLPDGTSIVINTSTVAVEDLSDGWRYRLAFRDLDPNDAGRLAELTVL